MDPILVTANNLYYELLPEQNHFSVIYVDITHRCNMACANCFLPNRNIPDMNIESLYDFARRLPKSTELRLLGGEPTLRTDLPEIIRTLKNLGHTPSLMTNGLKLADFKYAETLKASGLRRIGISMNGGDNDEIYKILDHKKCAQQKLDAVRNCAKLGLRFTMGAILQRGINESVPKKLYDLSIELKPKGFNWLGFRNVGHIGRFDTDNKRNFTFDELIQLISDTLNISEQHIRNYQTHDHQVWFPTNSSEPMRSLWIKITDWSPEPYGILPFGNKRRGRVTQDFKVAPAAEHFKLNENEY